MYLNGRAEPRDPQKTPRALRISAFLREIFLSNLNNKP